MKKLLAVVVLITTMSQASFFQEKDKQQHIVFMGAVSFLGSNIAYDYGLTKNESALVGFALGMAVGIGKELYDTNFDHRDIWADAIGSGVGVIPVWVIYEW